MTGYLKLLFLLGWIIPLSGFSQEHEEDEVLHVCIVDPEFPGGRDSLVHYISTNLKYPEESLRMCEEGVVYVHFVVNKDGSIVDVSIRKGVTEALDNEAIRLVSEMPNWSPGRHHGKLVRTKYTIPVHFQLNR